MKKISCLLICAFIATSSFAQQAVKGTVLFKDAVAEYEQALNSSKEESPIGEQPKEGSRYHFERWKWYWAQHLDQDGYMMPAAANFIEAQKLLVNSRSKTTLPDQSKWEFMGPTTSGGGYEGIGRINVIKFHPTDANTYWVGAAGGGIWKTTNDGQAWVSLNNNLPRLDVSDIVVNPDNVNTIYICTGDRDSYNNYSTNNPRYNNVFSVGVLKSLDGGATWNTTSIISNVFDSAKTNCLVMAPNDTSRLILAASDGMYRTTNSGVSWTKVDTNFFIQVVYHPTNPSIVYATGYNEKWEGQMFVSIDGGDTWTKKFSSSAYARIALAVTPASPDLVRMAVCNRTNGLLGIVESVNSGNNFNWIYQPSSTDCSGYTGDLLSYNPYGVGCGNQGSYDLVIAISPTNSSLTFFGGVNTWGSTDGGRNWQICNQWTQWAPGVVEVHADKHWFAYNPNNGLFFECNDGGVYSTVNPLGNLWADKTNGMGITQFYRNAVSNISTLVIGGSQDNGSKGLQGGAWKAVGGGDGMHCAVDPLDSNVYYTGVQRGVIYLNNYSNTMRISDNIPGNPTGAWITPYIINPNNNQQLIAGYKHVYFSPNKGGTWSSIQGTEVSPQNDLTFIGMTYSATPTLYALNPNDETVYYVDNYQAGQTATFKKIQVPYKGYISDLQMHPTDSGRFYLSFAAYNGALVAEYNKGNWSRIDAGLPNVPVRCIEYDTTYSVMYVGTDLGVYFMDTSTNGQWVSFSKNLPVIEVTDLGINYERKELWASTFGRGMWKSVLQGAATSIVVIPYAEDVFNIAPNPAKDNFKIIAGPSIASGKAIRVNLIDYTGKVVLSKEASFNGGKAINIQTNNLPAGLYIVELANENTILGRKRVVMQ